MEEGAGVPQCQPLPGPGGLRETGVPSCPSPPAPSGPGVELPAAPGAVLPTSDGGPGWVREAPEIFRERHKNRNHLLQASLGTIPERYQCSSKAWAPTNHPGDGK